MQRRIYSKTNLRAAMKQRKARLKAADTGKTLIFSDLYDAMMDVDDDTEKSFMRAPDLGDADQASVDVIMRLLDDGLSIQEIIILAHEPATEFSQHAGRDDDMMFLQFYQLAKGNPNFDQGKLDEQAGNRMVGFKNCKELYIPQPQQTTDIEAQRAQRQFDACEPENRLVARTLEGRFEQALARYTQDAGNHVEIEVRPAAALSTP